MNGQKVRFKQIREDFLNLTQNKFAQLLGITQISISRYENEGRHIPSTLLEKLASDVKINSNWFLTGDGPVTVDTGAAVKFARNKLRLSREEFAERLEISAGELEDIESGEIPPSPEVQKKMFETGVRSQWILYGTLPVLKSEETEETRAKEQEEKRQAMTFVQSVRREPPREIPPNGTPLSGEFVRIPLVAEVGAGEAIFQEENIIETMTVPRDFFKGYDPSYLFSTVVRGDSMSPEIQEGDLVVASTEVPLTLMDGLSVAVIHIPDDGGVVKKVKMEPAGIRLISVNPKYPERFIPRGEARDVVAYRMLWLMRRGR